jgi:hypothetical protein
MRACLTLGDSKSRELDFVPDCASRRTGYPSRDTLGLLEKLMAFGALGQAVLLAFHLSPLLAEAHWNFNSL